MWVVLGVLKERIMFILKRRNRTTDLFIPIVQRINELRMWQYESTPDQPGSEAALAGSKENAAPSTEQGQRLIRIIADHVRAATFIIADGVMPGNVEQGYICRRLIRRAVRCAHELSLPRTFIAQVAQAVITGNGTTYSVLEERKTTILNELTREEDRFRQTLSRGLREFQKQEQRLRQRGETILSGEVVFRLFDTFGFPPRLIAELAQEHGLSIDQNGFDVLFKQHQERSRQANQKKF